MDELIHVEVLGRTGEVAHRVGLVRLPATIGRAYDNDVIIDDPYVSPITCASNASKTGPCACSTLTVATGCTSPTPIDG